MSVPRGTNVDMPATSVAHIIQQCVELGRRTPYSETDIRFAVVPFLRWTVLEAGMDPELDELFSTRTIEQYVQSAARDYSAGVLGNIRTRLFRLAEQIGDPDGRRVPISALPPANPAKPYGRREIASMMSWANTHATPSRRASAINLLALGLGAGLSTSEIASLRWRHVTFEGNDVVLLVHGARERSVVMVRRWAHEIIPNNDGDPDGFLFRPDRETSWRNVVSNFVSRLPKDIRPQPQRLRATWIVAHLNAGTNVITLMRAAGVDSLEAFTRYTGFAEASDSRREFSELTMHSSPRA